MLTNKFLRQQEKARGREEWAWHNEGHWRCPLFKYCWEEEIKLSMAENCLECNEAIIISSHPKEFALMIEDLQPEITVDSRINGSRSTISWGAKPTSTIG
jgi:hypothetical protein